MKNYFTPSTNTVCTNRRVCMRQIPAMWCGQGPGRFSARNDRNDFRVAEGNSRVEKTHQVNVLIGKAELLLDMWSQKQINKHQSMYHGGVGEELWAMVMTVEEELEGDDGGRGRQCQQPQRSQLGQSLSADWCQSKRHTHLSSFNPFNDSSKCKR